MHGSQWRGSLATANESGPGPGLGSDATVARTYYST